MQVEKGLSLTDILMFLHELLLQIQYPPPVMNFLLSEMSHIEYRLSHGTSEKLQLAALVGVFKQACAMTEQYARERDQKQIKQ
jgi:replication factor C subunit 3/5